jgi:hypothetical protein
MAQQASEGLEKQLLHLLRFSGLQQDNLRELVNIVVQLQSKGLDQFRVFPKGLPVVDGLTVQGTVEASNIAGVLSSILTQTPRLGGVSIFPYGIINPEAFQVNVTLGNVAEAGAREAGAVA